jgi:hypothetical protein
VKERKVLQQAQVMRLRLAEADAGIDDDAPARDAKGDERLDPLPEPVKDIERHIVVARITLHGLGAALRVHDADRQGVFGGKGGESGIKGEASHIVDEVGTDARGLLRHGGLAGVDGDGRRDFGADGGDHRRGAADFVIDLDRGGPRAGGFAAHIEDRGSGARHRMGMGERLRGIEMLAAVGKAVRGDIEDAHDLRRGHVERRDRRAGCRKTGHRVVGQVSGGHQVWGGIARQHLDRVEPAPAACERQGTFGAGGVGAGDGPVISHHRPERAMS